MITIDPQDRKLLHLKTAIRTVALYAIFAGLWIYFSDRLLAWFFTDPIKLTQAQTLKGWLYVAITAGLLYLYLNHCLQKLNNHEEALEREKDKVQQETRERFDQLSLLFDSMQAVVYVSDLATYELLYVNNFAAEAFGQEWRNRKCYHYLQEGIDQPCEFCTNAQLLKDNEPGNPVTWEFLNTKNQHWYECYDKAIRWTDGRMARLEVAFDITERKELEKIKDSLLSSMSHEMRTPLTAISGFAELLLNEPEIPERQRHHIGIIYKEADKLAELINRFLDIRRLKVDKSRVNYERLPVQDLLEKAKKDCRGSKEHHKIRIHCQTETQVFGNRKELTQVFTQLLENACRYSPVGGEISLTALINDAQETSISVTDQGIGIPRHELESIFDPFHRLDIGDSRSTGGVGLGLCVARDIITLHGGRIQVESAPGRGSTFTVLLPQPVDRESSHQGETAGAR